MRLFTSALAALSFALAGSVSPIAFGAEPQELPLKRVILSTSGLVNFEHEGSIDGNATIALPVRMDQVDDLLKSLVIFDGAGSLGGVSLPGKEPLSQAFRDLPFSPGDLDSPVSLLNALKGAAVTVTGPTTVSGKLVSVTQETVQLPDGGGSITRNRVTIMTADGMKTLVLEDLNSLQFTDPKVQGQISQALDAIYNNRIRDQRNLSIDLLGQGQRDVTMAYVVEAPLWKSAYRLVLPKDGDKAFVQGWGILENMTGSDWTDIDLTLTSGNPVTWRQRLYDAYYVARPVLPVEVFGRIMPRTDTGTISTANTMEMADAMPEGGAGMAYEASPVMSPAPAAAPMAPRMQVGALAKAAPMEMAARQMAMPGFAADASMPAVANRSLANLAQATSSSDATAQVLFHFPQAVSVKSGNSLMVPFTSAEMSSERIWLYQPDTHPTHPLVSVRLKNDTATALPPGILTLYDTAETNATAFIGDAQMPMIPKGEDRLISFALDARTNVDKIEKSDSTVGRFSISQGVLRIQTVTRFETSYTVKAPAEEARTVLIEQPRRPGWTLISPDPKEVEVTEGFYRLKLPVEAGKAATAKVVLELPGEQVYALTSLDTAMLTAYANRDGMSAEMKAAFEQLVAIRRELDEARVKINDIDMRRNTIQQDQDRLRQNLSTIGQTSDLGRRYLDKMGEQETQLEKLTTERDIWQGKADDAEKRLNEAAGKMAL